MPIAGSQISEYVIYRDITERKRSEQRLRQSEAYLTEAQRLSQTGSWAWNPATGENTYGSEECLRVLGFDPAGPIPRFEELFQRIHPDDQAASRERFEKAIREKADFEFGYRIVHPDKGVRDIHVVGHAVFDRSGDIGEFVGTVIDVTERKEAEQELQQLVDFVPRLIVVLDSGGKMIRANRAAREYTGLTLEEFQSLDVIGRVIHPDDVEGVRAARKHGFAGSEPFELDARLLGKDGIHRWFRSRTSWIGSLNLGITKRRRFLRSARPGTVLPKLPETPFCNLRTAPAPLVHRSEVDHYRLTTQ